jgi:aminopeptidase N
VGIAQAADVDDKGLYLQARVVDDEAWRKVKEGVYKGFSIGGRALQRDPQDRRVVTALELSEISLVDRPANPEAVIDLYKVGARNSAADLARIQRVHDTVVELGASCGEAEKHAGAADIAKFATLADEVRALAAAVARQGAMLERLAAEPAAPKYLLAAQAVAKGEDGAAREDEPKTPLEAIRKAQRNPMRLALP